MLEYSKSGKLKNGCIEKNMDFEWESLVWQLKKPCIKDFKEENLNSYDFADNRGTAQYERRVMCAWYETKFKTDKVINEKSPVWR